MAKEVRVEREAQILKERDPYVRTQTGDVAYSTVPPVIPPPAMPTNPRELVQSPAFIIGAVVAAVTVAIIALL